MYIANSPYIKYIGVSASGHRMDTAKAFALAPSSH